jgi:hypothetical protein
MKCKILIAEFRHLRLEAQGLAAPVSQTPKEVVSRLGAVQAQDFNMAKWAIGIRLPNSTEQSVMEALNKGEILRTHILRPTWHFVSPENIRAFASLSANKIKSSMKARDRQLGLSEELFGKVNNLIFKALEGNKHLSLEALSDVLRHAGIELNSSRMYHFMLRAEAEAIVCSGALQGTTQTYALLDERVPPTARLSRDEALAQLARIYFTSRYPATLQDFVWWSGLSVGDARKGLEAVKQFFLSENWGGQTFFFPAEIEKPCSNIEKSLLLLPAFDEYIIAYRDRSAVISEVDKAISSNGIFHPTIIADGKVIGLWRKTTAKNKPLTFEYFQQPDSLTEKMTEEAATRWKSFWGITFPR